MMPGFVTTIAGGGPLSQEAGLPGDGGPATQAAFNAPSCLAFDRDGNLYVCDRDAARSVRSIAPA